MIWAGFPSADHLAPLAENQETLADEPHAQFEQPVPRERRPTRGLAAVKSKVVRTTHTSPEQLVRMVSRRGT